MDNYRQVKEELNKLDKERNSIISKIENLLKNYSDCLKIVPKVCCETSCEECIAIAICDLLFPQLIEEIMKKQEILSNKK